jgi:hypothetical protein
MLWRNLPPPYSTLKMGVRGFFETWVTAQKTTWLHNSEDHNPDFHCCGNSDLLCILTAYEIV